MQSRPARQQVVTFSPSKVGAGCTEVVSADPFWYFRSRFHESIEEIAGNLNPAEFVEGVGYRLVVAGEWSGLGDLPLSLVLGAKKTKLDGAHTSYLASKAQMQTAQAAMATARQAFFDALNETALA